MIQKKGQKIIVNCRFLTQQISGVQRFAIELSKELKKLNPDIIFVAPKNIIHFDLARELGVIKVGHLKGHLWEQIELKSYVKNINALLISLCNTAPLFLKKQVITIHDLCFIHHPEWFSFLFRKAYSYLIPRIANNALHIFTVSETSKKEIVDFLNIKENKLSVIYNAVAPVFKKESKKERLHSPEKEKYILTVSSHHPRKNFKRLIEAFSDLNIEGLKLIIVGNFNRHFKDEKISVSKSIMLKENVNDKELIVLYQNADLFVYPSLYEGFGIPIIEAMSLGTSVCVSDIPVFREICENNAVYFDPYSIDSIKENILHSLSNPVSEVFLRKYSWIESAKKVHSIIEVLMETKKV